ncbi:hypothetical protein KY285_001882 [Solanum tuberosum]|nr:hypothetical protein KY285_001882 [Solanum tuberosum]
MPNYNHSLKTPLSQEVENPSSFDFSIPTPDESPSTPVCGGGEMVESVTPQTKVMASPVSHSDKVLVRSPTLVLSDEKYRSSEAQFVAKPSTEPFSEETKVASMVVSSTISERLFEGDLPEGRGPDSCLLTTGAELVVVQSLASLRRDTQPTLLDQELRSPDQVSHESQPVFDQTPISLGVEDDEEEEEEPQLRWRSKDVSPATRTDSAEERKRKGKGKLAKTHLKGEKKRYGTRSVTQKVLGSAMETNVAQIERIRKIRQVGSLTVEPISTSVPVDDSET